MPEPTAATAAHDYINKSLRPLAIAIAQLTPDPKNARKHNARNNEATEASLRQSGQAKCIVVWEQTAEQGGALIIVAGNGTVECAKKLGWSHVAANVRPFESEADAIAYALADNRTAELAEWDFPELAERLGDLKDADWKLGNLGWEDYELEPLLNADFKPAEIVDGDEDDEDTTAQVPGDEPVEVGGRNGDKHWKILITTEAKEELDSLLGTGWSGDDLVAAARKAASG